MTKTLTNTELTELFKPLLSDCFEVDEIRGVDYKVNGRPGHPFMIGPAHVAHASDYHSGLLTPDAIDSSGHGCYWTEGAGYGREKCNQPWSAHTHDEVLFVKLLRNLGNKEAANCLFKAKALMEEHKIAGVAFLNLDKEFTIAKPEEQNADVPNESGE